MKIVVNDYSYRKEHFYLVFDGKYYVSVNHKFVDENGKLTKELHFDDLHPSDSILELTNLLRFSLDMKHYMESGWTKAEAFSLATGTPIEYARVLFEK